MRKINVIVDDDIFLGIISAKTQFQKDNPSKNFDLSQTVRDLLSKSLYQIWIDELSNFNSTVYYITDLNDNVNEEELKILKKFNKLHNMNWKIIKTKYKNIKINNVIAIFEREFTRQEDKIKLSLDKVVDIEKNRNLKLSLHPFRFDISKDTLNSI